MEAAVSQRTDPVDFEVQVQNSLGGGWHFGMNFPSVKGACGVTCRLQGGSYLRTGYCCFPLSRSRPCKRKCREDNPTVCIAETGLEAGA